MLDRLRIELAALTSRRLLDAAPGRAPPCPPARPLQAPQDSHYVQSIRGAVKAMEAKQAAEAVA